MIESVKKPEASIVVIFGAVGDLSKRKLAPALYNLMLENWMPEDFAVIGVSYHEHVDESLKQLLRESIDEFSRNGKTEDAAWKKFADNVSYFKADFTDEAIYNRLNEKILEIEEGWNKKANRVFYLSVAPRFIDDISININKARLAEDARKARIVVEKPFGHDLESAKELNQKLIDCFHEDQIYRIDHYLGKETVQNIMAFRFANAIFEPLWNRNYIDHIQITVAEKVGVEGRGNYYDQSGAVRDMIQNHLLQLLCMIGMEPPITYQSSEIRNRKADVLNAVRKYKPEEVAKYAVRGQYGKGHQPGSDEAYRGSRGVDEDSNTETFAAIKFYIDNWRWKDVPFYLRTGKSLPEKNSTIVIQFKPVSLRLFPCEAGGFTPNLLYINIQPEEGITLRFQAKKPGLKMTLKPVEMDFNYEETYKKETPEAYETLLLDVMQGESALFMRDDQVEAAWNIVMPLLKHWEKTKAKDFPNYENATWGPQAAHDLLEKDGRKWLV